MAFVRLLSAGGYRGEYLMKRTKSLAVAMAVVGLSACTTTERVNVVQPGDTTLTCSQLRAEFAKLDEIRRDGQSDQGINAANVGAVLFFWPAAVGNYFSARDAMEIAGRRQEHLMVIYNQKNCDNPANANLAFPVPSELLGPIGFGGL
ncbi:hypothetical protein JIP62_07130 [Brevundimonas vitis]|uniref:Lipoprotein n=1 Tax=Brevundimonas vitisensis TaxID=2800818 RepID=A0ABX7BRJ1_9CAUL|nr:hypothetical protein [Brevundimonas vitisensis]QQQ19851.1 hypothetical protein JIP62_07130 [Brevundimonas vitisensis]